MLAEQNLDFGQNVRNEPNLPVEKRLSFVGSGGEYFRIWIVNLLLSILTLGIYSAWAKVRREQYFHRNTLLDGSGFDYHGNPKAILKGRVIAVGLVAILSLTENLAPQYYFLALLLCVPLVPWLLIRSFIFRARNTSFRGLRFDFLGTYKGFCKAFWGYILLFVLIIVLGGISEFAKSPEAPQEEVSVADILKGKATPPDNTVQTGEEEGMVIFDEAEKEGEEESNVILEGSVDDEGHVTYGANEGDDFSIIAGLIGLAIGVLFLALLFALFFLLPPAFTCTFKRFQMNHFAFGASRFQTLCRFSSFFGLYFRAFWPLMCLGVPTVILFIAVAVAAPKAFVGIGIILAIWFMVLYAVFLITIPYLTALISNQVWNNTRLEGHRFVSDQKFWSLTKVVLVNWLLILLTAGLCWPWAKVRMAAYRASHTAVLVDGDIDHFIAGASQEKSAIGEEIADIFDFDLAI